MDCSVFQNIIKSDILRSFILIILIHLKVISTDHCNIVGETEESTSICVCDHSWYNDTPSIDTICGIIRFERTSINGMNKNWFTHDKFNNVSKFIIKESNVTARDFNFWNNLDQIEIIQILKCSFEIQHIYWPREIKIIYLEQITAPNFTITQLLPKLTEIRLTNCGLKHFPRLNEKLPLEIINLNDNPNIRVKYEDVVYFCRLRKIYTNLLPGINEEPESDQLFCDCFRLSLWLKRFRIESNIHGCKRLRKKNSSRHKCHFDYSFGKYKIVDPCGRTIQYIGSREVFLPKVRTSGDTKRFLLMMIPFFIISLLVICALAYIFYFKVEPAETSQ